MLLEIAHVDVEWKSDSIFHQPNLILEIIKNMFSIISGSQVIIDIYRPVDVDIIIIKTKSLLSTGESP